MPQSDTEFRTPLVAEIKRLRKRVAELEASKQESEGMSRGSVEGLTALLRTIPDIFFHFAADGTFIGCQTNDVPGMLLPPAEFLGKRPEDVLPPELAAETTRCMKQALSTGEIQTQEYSLQVNDGLHHYESRMVPIGNGETIAIVRDNTEHKRAEEALRDSEEYLRALSDASFEAIFLSEKGICLGQNSTAQAMFGYTPEEAIGKPGTDWIVPEDRDRVRENMGAGREDCYEATALRRDGTTFAAEIQARMIEHQDRQVRVTALRDITERKQVEEALREKERFHEALLNDMLTFVGILETNGDIVFINNTPLRVGGLELQDVIGKKFYDAPWWTHRDEVRETIKRDVAKCAAGESLVHDVQIRTADGALMWIEFNMHPVRDEHGAVQYLVPEGRDITERKQVEEERERLTHAIEQAAETIVITDSEGLIQYANPAFEQITGYTCEEAIGQNPRIIKSSKHDAAFYDDLWKTITDGKIWRGRLINKKKDGTLYTEKATISPVRDPSGKTTNYIAVKRDITREAELEAQLRQAQKMDSLGTLAGGIAHDFNNILSPILGYADMAMDILSEDCKAHKYCKEVLNASQRAAELVEQILLFSRQAEQEEKLIRLHPAVNQALKLLRASFPATSTIDSRIDVDCGAVLGDPTQIHQIVMNLCTNAHKALPKTGGVIQVTLADIVLNEEIECLGTRLPSGEYVCLSVSDNGHGIDEATMERMFEPFFTTKDVGEGTGLGLSIVHGIISHHGGGITVDSEVGAGTTITAYFPRSADHSSAERPLSRTCSDGRDARVLIVDDEPSVAGMVAEMLRNLNYKVTVETSSVLALERFRNEPHGFDLVLSDLLMPEMTGDQMVKEMLAIRPRLPVVIMTGYADKGVDEISRSGDARECIKKPIRMNDLAAAIEKTLDSVTDKEEVSR